ncbi:hypothetical protein ZIOFF_073050 [Zingiber officinale]|uniref:Uncharacterized protein n=1 Tax=Zingiber officinale TaxID=94328 RepID=A0A8J5ESH7_ZINOF|nr:hypothetical protein ZIOFF_073050 [Zingiber officinale]
MHTVLAVDAYSDKIKHLLDAVEGQEASAALGVVGSSSTASISSTTPGSRTINLATICTPVDYHTRPLDTIFSNFIDALPAVSFETPGLVHFQLDFFVLFFGINLVYCGMCKLGIAKKTTSVSFISQHVKCMGIR